MINTNVLICCSNSEDSNILSDVFLKHGLASTVIDSTKAVRTLFESDGIDRNKFKFIVLGMDFSEEQGLELLRYINDKLFGKYPDSKMPLIIAMSVFSGESFVKQLQANRVISFLKRPLDARRTAYQIAVLVYKYRDLLPPKQPIFIEPDEQELMRGNYRIKNGRHESVKILQVSIDGVRVAHYHLPDADKFNPAEDDFIEHFVFEANDDIIDTDVRIVTEPTGRLYFEFTHFYGKSREYLLEYIKSHMR